MQWEETELSIGWLCVLGKSSVFLSLCFLSAKQNDACFVGSLYELKGLMGVKASDVVECSVHVHSFLSQLLPQSPPSTYCVLGSEYAGTLLSQRSQTRQWFSQTIFITTHSMKVHSISQSSSSSYLSVCLSLSHTHTQRKQKFHNTIYVKLVIT